MEDFVKITQFLVDKKKMKGTYDEEKFQYEKLVKKIKAISCTFKNSQSNKK